MNGPGSVFELRGIWKSFGDLSVISGVDIRLAAGKVTAVLGPSGCGKSTLLHICAGLLSTDRGRVFLDQREITGRTGQVAYLQQKDLLLPWRTVLDNVALPLLIQGVPKARARARAGELLGRFGLDGFENHYPSQLSGGMRQRAALLRTYLFRGNVILLDEPFGALDTITRSRMHQWLLGILREFRPAVLLVTHDIDEALLLSDEVVVLSKRPATVVERLEVRIARPRTEETAVSGEFVEMKRRALAALKRGEGERQGVRGNDIESPMQRVDRTLSYGLH